jgi:hypothetical protein
VSWQGIRTKGQKKVVKGVAGKERVPVPGQGVSRSSSKGDAAYGKEGKRNGLGKRPAVAARKEKARKQKSS